MTHSSKPSSYPYARFIPHEEIVEATSWRFDNVDGSPHQEDLEAEAAKGPSPEAIAADIKRRYEAPLMEIFESAAAADA